MVKFLGLLAFAAAFLPCAALAAENDGMVFVKGGSFPPIRRQKRAPRMNC